MYVVAVTVFVKPECVEPFIQAVLANARATRQEPGNLRFDVVRHEQDPNRFLLYEVYHTPDDFARHQQTAHYLTWKQTVAPYMAQPREGHKHQSIFYGDTAQ